MPKKNSRASKVRFSCSPAKLIWTLCHWRAPEVTAQHRKSLLKIDKKSIFASLWEICGSDLKGRKLFFQAFSGLRVHQSCCMHYVAAVRALKLCQKMIFHRDTAFFVFSHLFYLKVTKRNSDGQNYVLQRATISFRTILSFYATVVTLLTHWLHDKKILIMPFDHFGDFTAVSQNKLF